MYKHICLLVVISALLAACSTSGGSPSAPATPQSTPLQSAKPAASQIPSEETPTPTGAPAYDCSRVESIPTDGEEGRSIVGAIQAFYQMSEEEPVDIVSIQHQGDYYAVQAGYKVNRMPGPPDFFILNRSGGDVEVAFYIGGSKAYTRSTFIRNLYAQVPDLPQELLNCLDLRGIFNLPTPTPD
jgi:hypothetical protein